MNNINNDDRKNKFLVSNHLFHYSMLTDYIPPDKYNYPQFISVWEMRETYFSLPHPHSLCFASYNSSKPMPIPKHFP